MMFINEHHSFRPPLSSGVSGEQINPRSQWRDRGAVFKFPNGRFKGRVVDALARDSDEGRGMAAISLGEVPSNRYIREFPNGETQLSKPQLPRFGGERTQGIETS